MIVKSHSLPLLMKHWNKLKNGQALVKPTPEKLEYFDMRLINFPYFGMSTISRHQQGTGIENPGIYLRTDIGRTFVFDHVSVEVLKRDKSGVMLRITSPTSYGASVSILAENKIRIVFLQKK